MTITQSVFVVFFAIFWGTVASVQGRWKMFHWPLIRYPHVALRLTLSFVVLNVCPILFFAFVFFLLRNDPMTPSTSQWGWSETLRQVFASVVPAFAVFGFYRLWLSIVELCPSCFYQAAADQEENIKAIEPTLECLHIDSQYWWWNLLFASLYLAVATIAPWYLAS